MKNIIFMEINFFLLKPLLAKILLTLFFWIVIPVLSFAIELPTINPVPGGIVKIYVANIDIPAPQVFFNKEKVLVIKSNKKWMALVGIPLSSKIGMHEIIIKKANNISKKFFYIWNKEYPEEYLIIKKKRMVTGFTKQDLKIINADKKIINFVKQSWIPNSPSVDFIVPVVGKFSSLFGLKRFIDGISKQPHKGLDIAREVGAIIRSPEDAKVINTRHYYFNGKTVFLDHGQGLITAYLHMNSIKVKTGQLVKKGDILGTVGKTGRVTGPHLHWIVYLNKTPVDPMLFVSKHLNNKSISKIKIDWPIFLFNSWKKIFNFAKQKIYK